MFTVTLLCEANPKNCFSVDETKLRLLLEGSNKLKVKCLNTSTPMAG